MADFWQFTIGDLLGSSIVSALVGLVLLRRTKTLESEIGAEFERRLRVFESTRAWKQQALFELLGPVAMQLRRTHEAYRRWTTKDLGLEAKVIREGNVAIRDLLLEKGHLIPGELQADAVALITHYDAWLLKFDALRTRAADPESAPFVFVGPDGYPFPHEAEARFLAEMTRVQRELYGEGVFAAATT